jgi:hypothetical protein
MSADPESERPTLDERTQAALERLSRVIFRSLERLDRLERQQEAAQPEDQPTRRKRPHG